MTAATWVFVLAATALISAGIAFYFWTATRRMGAHLRRVEGALLDERKEKERYIQDMMDARRQLDQKSSDLEEIAREFGDLLNNPPFPTDKELGKHLGTLASRLAEAVKELATLNESSKEPLTDIAEEARKAQHVDRKARFDEYYVVLSNAVARTNDTMTRLRSAIPMCTNLSEALERGELDFSAVHSSIGEIVSVLERSSGEYSLDGIRLSRIRDINLDHARTMRELIEARRDSEGATRRRALTALEKFRRIKPTGSRDGFTRG